MRPNKQKRIDEVELDLSNGLSRAQIIRKFKKKYEVKEDCVDGYIRQAKKQAEIIRQETKEQSISDNKTKEVAARVEALITKEEVLTVVVGILNDDKVKPSDRIAAAKQISTMLDFNATIKTDVSISGEVKNIIQLFEDQEPLTE
ncbi:MAG: hypothetical protein IPG21_04790 [Saprospiraceae bacterium]|nr:hypothetical protein [Candidatus Vicinibacter affinis]